MARFVDEFIGAIDIPSNIVDGGWAFSVVLVLGQNAAIVTNGQHERDVSSHQKEKKG